MESNTEKVTYWAIVELFGHQKIVGKISSETIAGGSFLRVDVPECNGQPAFTRFFGANAIYSISPCAEAIARALVADHQLVPVQRYELPLLEDKINEPLPQNGDTTENKEPLF